MTLAWIYSDETSPAIQQVHDLVIASEAWVPAIWRLEVGNSLLTAVRRHRITAAFRDAALSDLLALRVMSDTETDTHAWSSTIQIADLHKLTLYDASYLELAQRRRLPLATLDEELRAAAAASDVMLLGK